MTLIAILASEDKAEVMTDSLSYLRNLGSLSSSSKAMPIAHLNAVVLCSGDGVFANMVKSMVLAGTSLPELGSVDALLQELPARLAETWADATELAQGRSYLYPSTAYVVGWSYEAQSYVAYLFTSLHQFEPERINGLHVVPMAGVFQPTSLEAETFLVENHDVDGVAAFMDAWTSKPPHPEPAELGDWLKVGLYARTRALNDTGRQLVGGSLYYTSLTPDVTTTLKIHTFDDTGDELLQMVGYSQHPVAQERPCWCDSGKRHIDCHLADSLDEPCGCGSSELFRECCMVGTLKSEVA